jgi:hypothetical protein
MTVISTRRRGRVVQLWAVPLRVTVVTRHTTSSRHSQVFHTAALTFLKDLKKASIIRESIKSEPFRFGRDSGRA